MLTALLALLAALALLFGYCTMVATVDRFLDRLPNMGGLQLCWVTFTVVFGVALVLPGIVLLGTFMEWWCLPVGVLAILGVLIHKTKRELNP